MSAVSSTIHLQRPLDGPALAETLDGGQCFRWRAVGDSAWHGVSGPVAARLHARSPTEFDATLYAGNESDLRTHLADDLDWHALADALPHRTDAHLATCLAAFPGLRILRQPMGEALLCFLCSATKQIVQIKQMVALLAARHGRILATPAAGGPRGAIDDRATAGGPSAARGTRHPIDDKIQAHDRPAAAGPSHPMDDMGRDAAGPEAIHALPTWSELADVSEEALRACLLGFRARHVAGVARFLAGRPGWLEETARLPYAEAKARLLELPGVGEKIADCVLLFGAGRLEAFPVDVWILRVMEERYGLRGWSPGQIAHFGRVHFGPLAGLAQQYLFAWERRNARV